MSGDCKYSSTAELSKKFVTLVVQHSHCTLNISLSYVDIKYQQLQNSGVLLNILFIYIYFALGLHVNLSEGVPVSNVHTVGSLLSADKVFLGKAGIRKALEIGALNMDEVHSLTTAQVLSQFISLFLLILHVHAIDLSHCCLHMQHPRPLNVSELT